MRLITLTAAAWLLALSACGESGSSAADLAAEAEADRLDSIDQLLETQLDSVAADAAALEMALDSLDVLFPEGE